MSSDIFILGCCEVSILVSCGHCNNHHTLGGWNHRNVFSHRSRSLKSRYHQNWFLQMALRGSLFHTPVWALAGGGEAASNSWHALACGCVTPVSTIEMDGGRGTEKRTEGVRRKWNELEGVRENVENRFSLSVSSFLSLTWRFTPTCIQDLKKQTNKKKDLKKHFSIPAKGLLWTEDTQCPLKS